MIIHINGISGSGKTTLGNKLKKHNNLIVIDMDDINDANALNIINDEKYNDLFSFDKMNDFFDLVKENDIISFKKLFKEHKDKILVLIGMVFPKEIKLDKIANYKYFIKIDLKTLYKRYNLRTMYDICNNKENIVDLFNDEKNIHKISMILLFKFKIRGSFQRCAPYLRDHIIDQEKNAKKKNII